MMGWAEHDKDQPTIVIITSDGPEHRYVANRILEEFEVRAIIVDRGRPQTRVQRLQFLNKRYGAGQLVSRLLLRITALLFRDSNHRQRDLLRVLGRSARDFADPDLVRYVDGINTLSGRTVVEEAGPDFLLIYGTGIVGPKVLAMASVAALNLHTGMSPDYRGSDCTFWPIFNREYQHVGATVHECTELIDGGTIYARGQAELHTDDGQFGVFARCVEIGAELYASTLRRASNGLLDGQEQDLTVGREYRAVDKRLRHDLAVRWMFRSGEFRRDALVRPGTSASSTAEDQRRPSQTEPSPSSDGVPQPPWPSVSVTIVNHRSRDLLRACLESLRQYP
ncbi:MAG: formyl transferase, partial [Acidimicrobiia bacterium]